MVPRETPRAAECSKEIFEAIAPREGVPGIASSARSARSRRADAPGSVSVRRPSRAGLRSRASVRGMPLVEFACDGQLLFTVEASKRLGMLPRIGEALVVEEARYVVVDVEYGARRAGDPQRRELWPVVHVWLGWSLLRWQAYTFEFAVGVCIAEIVIVVSKFVMFLAAPEWDIWRTNWFINKIFVLGCFVMLLTWLIANRKRLPRRAS